MELVLSFAHFANVASLLLRWAFFWKAQCDTVSSGILVTCFLVHLLGTLLVVRRAFFNEKFNKLTTHKAMDVLSREREMPRNSIRQRRGASGTAVC